MAVYTKVNDDQLIEFISTYDIGFFSSFKGIEQGIENSNYLLKTTRGVFILTLYEKRIKAEDIPFFLDLMEHSSKRGIRCPKPVADQNGEMLKTLAGRPAVIVTFLTGSSVTNISVDHCGQLGLMLGKFHKAGMKFQGARKNDFSIESWREIAGLCSGKIEQYNVGLKDELNEELDYLSEHWPTELPGGIIHGDLFPDNVFFEENKLSGIIDFYFSCTDILAYDIGICLNAWCFDANYKFNYDKARKVLSEYRVIRELTVSELQALPILARGSAMRFLLTRLYDRFNTPENALVVAKDPTEYLYKLRFFRSLSETSQFSFID